MVLQDLVHILGLLGGLLVGLLVGPQVDLLVGLQVDLLVGLLVDLLPDLLVDLRVGLLVGRLEEDQDIPVVKGHQAVFRIPSCYS